MNPFVIFLQENVNFLANLLTVLFHPITWHGFFQGFNIFVRGVTNISYVAITWLHKYIAIAYFVCYDSMGAKQDQKVANTRGDLSKL